MAVFIGWWTISFFGYPILDKRWWCFNSQSVTSNLLKFPSVCRDTLWALGLIRTAVSISTIFSRAANRVWSSRTLKWTLDGRKGHEWSWMVRSHVLIFETFPPGFNMLVPVEIKVEDMVYWALSSWCMAFLALFETLSIPRFLQSSLGRRQLRLWRTSWRWTGRARNLATRRCLVGSAPAALAFASPGIPVTPELGKLSNTGMNALNDFCHD